MKNISIVLTLFLLFTAAVTAQTGTDPKINIGFVNSDAIMQQFSEAVKAQGEIQAQIEKWNKQLDSMALAFQQEVADYQKQMGTMPDDQKQAKETELLQKQQNIEQFREQKFGQQNGEAYLLREQLLEPIRQKIFDAIEQVAKEENIQFVFDKAGEISLLYAEEEYNLTFKVLDKLKSMK